MRKRVQRSRRRARARLASTVEGVKNPMTFQIVDEKREVVLPEAVIEKLLARDLAMGYFGLLPSDILRVIFSQLKCTDLCLLSMIVSDYNTHTISFLCFAVCSKILKDLHCAIYVRDTD
ncbi:hypothetical protein O6H91_20G064300 [Diphasiastrum complanatum]|uniref:Uncharacterized protein n=2 Tax=Diphasiastrum complanatum TaxID=34168 RepID=A0ACC2AQP8_DIPCM|nr:hypothetical protein O6H91_20G041500 [Diphasiastrum complanatum]KAJ7520037.1 hypothetical protein O6H91_20G064300 [Diphasiastrum complanatum]